MRAEITRVVFMGSPAFAVPSLHALVAAGYRVVAVVTQPDRPVGRGGRVQAPPVKVAAAAAGIPVLQPATLREEPVVAALRALEPDLVIVAAYGKILPRAVLEIPRRGALNVHASLLPRWRGASPVAAAILQGDAVTGVSIMEMVARMDAGPVLATRPVPILQDDTTGSLEERLAEEGASLLVETLPGRLDGSLVAVEQDERLATYCSTLSKDDGLLRREMTAGEAERAVRAYDPWPGACVLYRERRLAIWRAHVGDGSGVPGDVVVSGRLPAIAFREGYLVLDEVQVPGGRRVPGHAFLNGERGNLAERVGLA